MAESLSGASGAPIQGKEILGPPDIARSLFRIAHEILERNHGTQDIVVLGIPSGGAPLAHRLVDALAVASGEGTQWSEQAGQAQAAAVIFFLIVAAIALVQLRVTRAKEVDA